MRLLVVMTHYPYPPRTGSAILAYRNIKELAKKHTIHLVCADDLKERGDLDEFVAQVECVGRKSRPLYLKLLRYAFYMLQGFPIWMITSMSKKMHRRVCELIDQQDFDAILLYEITAIQYCPPRSYKKMIVNIEDPPSIKLGRMRALEVWSLWQKATLYINEKLTARYENSVLPKLARVLMLSEADRSDMHKQLGYDNLGCVSYGIDETPSDEVVTYEKRTKGMIVYSGNMHHPPNVDGALFFLRHIFPIVLEEFPSAKFWIVGSSPDKRILNAAKIFKEHVVITGKVNSPSEYVRHATVCICPIRLKIGVQTKILEALSRGTPVVTTPAGNSGILGCSGSQLWVADDPEKFAKRVVSLLNGENWKQLSEAGRALVTKRFSWKRSAAELEQHLNFVRVAT